VPARPQTQCPGGVCPRWYLLPYRHREQFRNQPQPSPAPAPGDSSPRPLYPTLPPKADPQSKQPPPAGDVNVAVDLGPLNKALQKNAESKALQKNAESNAKLADAVVAYVDAQRKAAEAEAQKKAITEVRPHIGAVVEGFKEGGIKGAGASDEVIGAAGRGCDVAVCTVEADAAAAGCDGRSEPETGGQETWRTTLA